LKHVSIKLLFVVSAFLAFSCSTAKKAGKSGKDASAMAKPPAKKPGKNDPQPYSKIITKDAKSDKGLFTVHNVEFIM